MGSWALTADVTTSERTAAAENVLYAQAAVLIDFRIMA
jgi:hypothetical protein